MTDQIYLKYQKDVEDLRKSAKLKLKLKDEEINKIFDDCFQQLNKQNNSLTIFLRIIKLIFFCLIVILLIFILLYHHQPTLSLVLRNVQSFIHPGLKVLRLVALPVIKLFPSLSEFYDESCLVENPYFQVSNMECWPCENIHSVINLAGPLNYTLSQSGIPYLIPSLNKSVTLEEIKKLYKSNARIFDQDAYRIKSNKNLTKIGDILNFESNNETDSHIMWRINRMNPARIIRQLFPKPSVINEWSGQSTERFILIDDLKAAPYILPNPECGSVLVTQGQGERTIVLKPTLECVNHCRATSVTLKATFSLWYNWWYWRPISLPTQNTSEISITYITSYC